MTSFEILLAFNFALVSFLLVVVLEHNEMEANQRFYRYVGKVAIALAIIIQVTAAVIWILYICLIESPWMWM